MESCGFHRSLLNFDSNNSIGEYAATDTFANMKTPRGGVGNDAHESGSWKKNSYHLSKTMTLSLWKKSYDLFSNESNLFFLFFIVS